MCNIISVVSFILEVITAIGTLGATMIALWLGLRETQCRINGVFIWGAPNDYQPVLLIQNHGNRIAVIETISITYGKSEVSTLNFFEEYKLKNYAVIEAGQVVKVPINTDWIKIQPTKNPKKKKILEITIRPREGRKYKSKQKYTYEELQGLLFGCGLFME